MQHVWYSNKIAITVSYQGARSFRIVFFRGFLMFVRFPFIGVLRCKEKREEEDQEEEQEDEQEEEKEQEEEHAEEQEEQEEEQEAEEN